METILFKNSYRFITHGQRPSDAAHSEQDKQTCNVTSHISKPVMLPPMLVFGHLGGAKCSQSRHHFLQAFAKLSLSLVKSLALATHVLLLCFLYSYAMLCHSGPGAMSDSHLSPFMLQDNDWRSVIFIHHKKQRSWQHNCAAVIELACDKKKSSDRGMHTGCLA
jgi:hypothetical protein